MEFSRAAKCLVLCKKEKCNVCHEKELQHKRQERKQTQKQNEPAKLNAPISLTSPERVKLTLQQYRLENKQLNQQRS